MVGASVSVFRDCRNAVGESPLWDADRACLWWVDTPSNAIHGATLKDERTRTLSAPSPAALALDDTGNLIVAAGHEWLRLDPETGRSETLAALGGLSGSIRFNDGVTDPKGRFWTGTLHEVRDPVGELFRLDGDGALSMVGGLRTQNGCAISPDGRTFYLADTHPDVRTIWAFDFDAETGTLENRRVFHQPTRGRPDGATVDADGCYWFAAVDGGCVVQVDPTGREMRAIDLPVSRPTKPAFGGPDLTILFVTSMSVRTDPATEPLAGAVFAVETGARGVPLPRVRSAATRSPDLGARQAPD